MHAIEGPVSSILASHASIHVGGNVNIMRTIHCGGVIFGHVHLYLPDSVTKYGIKRNIYFGYHLESKPILCSRRTKFFTVAMETQVLIEVTVELVELSTQLWTHLIRVLGTTIKIRDQRIFTFWTAVFILLGSLHYGSISVDQILSTDTGGRNLTQVQAIICFVASFDSQPSTEISFLSLAQGSSDHI
jgi:hypothetical protein